MWETIIEAIEKVNSAINGVVWGWPMIIMILGTGVLVTIRLRAMQVTKLGESINTTIVPVIKDLGKKLTTIHLLDSKFIKFILENI